MFMLEPPAFLQVALHELNASVYSSVSIQELRYFLLSHGKYDLKFHAKIILYPQRPIPFF